MKPDETKSRGHGEKRSRKMDQFIAALLANSSVEAAAAAVGIGRVTAWRWMQRQDVIDRLRQARREAWGRAMAQLQEAGPEAVEALRKILREAEGESPRVAASRVILELGLRVIELGDIEERLEKLETLAKNNWKGQAMTNLQIERRLAALEESMGTADAPPFDIEIVFVEPVDGCFGGRVKSVVKLSELMARRSDQQ